jgi:hypothetical protein
MKSASLGGSQCGCGGVAGEKHLDGCPATFPVEDLHLTFVKLDRSLSDGEPDSEASCLRAPGLIDTVERPEDGFSLGFGNAPGRDH